MALWRELKQRLELLPARLTQLILRLDREGRRHVIAESSGEPWLNAEALRAALPDGANVICWWQPVDGAAPVVAGPATGFPATALEQVNPEMGTIARGWAVEQLGDVRGAVVWDLYGGIGDTAVALAERGAQVVSVDADEKAIDWARRREVPRPVRFIAGKAECGISVRPSRGERPFTSTPHSPFRIPHLGWGERCDEVLRVHRRQNPRGRGGRESCDRGWGGARDPPRPRIGNAPLSPAARWSVVDRSRRAARGCRPVDVGVGGRAGGSRGAGRTPPRDRGGERQEQAVGRRRHGTRADARPGGADRGGGRAAGGCGGRSRGRRGDENGERAARAAAGDGPDGPCRRGAGGRKRGLARDPRQPGTPGVTRPYGPGTGPG